jgi:DNA-damage-inducible protein J
MKGGFIMSTSLLQVRVEDSLKEEANQIFEELGIDMSTAVRMFLKRSVMENGIPFKMTLPRNDYNAERGYRAMVEIEEASEKNGLSDMSLEEINEEINASRRERKVSDK